MLHAKLSLARRGPSTHEQARVHHAARRRGGGVAGCHAGAKDRKVAKLAILAVARDAPRTRAAHEAFAELHALGFKEGTNLTSETRWIDEDTRGPLTVAAEITQSAVDVLVIEGAESVLKAAMAANPPIVIYANNYDPIERGYAKTLSRPGGNVKRVFTRQPELAEKQLELLTQTFPTAVRLAMLWNSESVDQFDAAQRGATLLGLTVTSIELQKLPYDLDAAFRAIIDNGAQMLHVLSSPLFFPYRLQISQFAIRNRLPAIFIFRSYVEAGGLMSYGADRIAGARRFRSTIWLANVPTRRRASGARDGFACSIVAAQSPQNAKCPSWAQRTSACAFRAVAPSRQRPATTRKPSWAGARMATACVKCRPFQERAPRCQNSQGRGAGRFAARSTDQI
jgi:putative ABC transport system substrate-binding protein